MSKSDHVDVRAFPTKTLPLAMAKLVTDTLWRAKTESYVSALLRLHEVFKADDSKNLRAVSRSRRPSMPESDIISYGLPRQQHVKTTVMAQVVLSAKSGNDWTDNELIGLNVSYQNVDVPTFFGTSQLPVTSVSPVILNNDVEPLPPTVLSKDERLFFRYLHRAVVENEASVDDWAGHVLRILDYDGGDREIATKRELSFTMCGEWKWAKPDFVVLSGGQRTLLVQEDKVSSFDQSPPFLTFVGLARQACCRTISTTGS